MLIRKKSAPSADLTTPFMLCSEALGVIFTDSMIEESTKLYIMKKTGGETAAFIKVAIITASFVRVLPEQ